MSHQTDYQQRQNALNLCSKCPNICAPGKKMCPSHVRYHQELQKKKRLQAGMVPRKKGKQARPSNEVDLFS